MYSACMADEKMARRLKLARERRYDTAVEAAKALGLPEQTYLPHESGRTGFTRSAARYASFYGIRLEWLITGRGPMEPEGVDPFLEKFERLPPELRAEAMDFLDFLASRKK